MTVLESFPNGTFHGNKPALQLKMAFTEALCFIYKDKSIFFFSTQSGLPCSHSPGRKCTGQLVITPVLSLSSSPESGLSTYRLPSAPCLKRGKTGNVNQILCKCKPKRLWHTMDEEKSISQSVRWNLMASLFVSTRLNAVGKLPSILECPYRVRLLEMITTKSSCWKLRPTTPKTGRRHLQFVCSRNLTSQCHPCCCYCGTESQSR